MYDFDKSECSITNKLKSICGILAKVETCDFRLEKTECAILVGRDVRFLIGEDWMRDYDEFVAMFKARTGYQIVEPAHMELAEPSISDAFKLCVQKGATRVIVSPFFLFPGRHWLQDIPALVTDASKYHSGISFVITAPLGLHELMVDVMNDRIKYCLSHVAGDADECSVCAGTGKCRLYQT
ncbi:hypothetical protein ZIOFF_074974 [Zingiber officinale]|uniref:Sirohydrochlorin ferrochelatase n=1 Tax=Zingiber officinale TaxID=94328 RepID=A0A8J5ERS6_ZINOF|nr:hypothetical protein ZIOFF_074974 [Zingiber officinale]